MNRSPPAPATPPPVAYSTPKAASTQQAASTPTPETAPKAAASAQQLGIGNGLWEMVLLWKWFMGKINLLILRNFCHKMISQKKTDLLFTKNTFPALTSGRVEKTYRIYILLAIGARSKDSISIYIYIYRVLIGNPFEAKQI